MNQRAILLRICDALEMGDVAEAEAIVLAALEDGPTERPLACPECGLGFRFPGECDQHRRLVHAPFRERNEED